jgi:hypothetical protein
LPNIIAFESIPLKIKVGILLSSVGLFEMTWNEAYGSILRQNVQKYPNSFLGWSFTNSIFKTDCFGIITAFTPSFAMPVRNINYAPQKEVVLLRLWASISFSLAPFPKEFIISSPTLPSIIYE